MSSEYTGFFTAGDGHTITVLVFKGDSTVKVTKSQGHELITTVELTGDEATQVHHAKPTQPGTSWHVGKDLTIAPEDVDKLAGPLHKALMRLLN